MYSQCAILFLKLLLRINPEFAPFLRLGFNVFVSVPKTFRRLFREKNVFVIFINKHFLFHRLFSKISLRFSLEKIFRLWLVVIRCALFSWVTFIFSRIFYYSSNSRFVTLWFPSVHNAFSRGQISISQFRLSFAKCFSFSVLIFPDAFNFFSRKKTVSRQSEEKFKITCCRFGMQNNNVVLFFFDRTSQSKKYFPSLRSVCMRVGNSGLWVCGSNNSEKIITLYNRMMCEWSQKALASSAKNTSTWMEVM